MLLSTILIIGVITTSVAKSPPWSAPWSSMESMEASDSNEPNVRRHGPEDGGIPRPKPSRLIVKTLNKSRYAINCYENDQHLLHNKNLFRCL